MLVLVSQFHWLELERKIWKKRGKTFNLTNNNENEIKSEENVYL